MYWWTMAWWMHRSSMNISPLVDFFILYCCTLSQPPDLIIQFYESLWVLCFILDLNSFMCSQLYCLLMYILHDKDKNMNLIYKVRTFFKNGTFSPIICLRVEAQLVPRLWSDWVNLRSCLLTLQLWAEFLITIAALKLHWLFSLRWNT